MSETRKLYVGSMNDGVFIIDRPPRPAPNDDGPGEVADAPTVIATMAGNDDASMALARQFAAAPTMVKALRLHKAWADSERAGPDYGGQTRDTHPDGERIWRAWWNNQLDLCDRANRATDAALAPETEGTAPPQEPTT